jgi:hypothetical protein
MPEYINVTPPKLDEESPANLYRARIRVEGGKRLRNALECRRDLPVDQRKFDCPKELDKEGFDRLSYKAKQRTRDVPVRRYTIQLGCGRWFSTLL